MRWLITGGCGFIGSSLIRKLNAEGEHYIRVVDNLSVGSRDDLQDAADFRESDAQNLSVQAGQVELVVGDVLDESLALELAENMDVIIHLAANTGVGPSVDNPRMDCVTNVLGTLNYLEAARQAGVGRFVFASSGAPVGECTPPIHEDITPHPVSPYGASKLAGEGYCSAYFRTFGIATVVLRFGNVYGPGSDHKASVVAKFIKHALSGQNLEIYGDGGQTRDFVYIDDLVAAIRLAASGESIGGEIFQIATNHETTVKELADILISTLHAAGVDGFEIVYGEQRLGDVMRNFSDTSKAKQMLGWQCEVELQDGLHRTVNSFLRP